MIDRVWMYFWYRQMWSFLHCFMFTWNIFRWLLGHHIKPESRNYREQTALVWIRQKKKKKSQQAFLWSDAVLFQASQAGGELHFSVWIVHKLHNSPWLSCCGISVWSLLTCWVFLTCFPGEGCKFQVQWASVYFSGSIGWGPNSFCWVVGKVTAHFCNEKHGKKYIMTFLTTQ